ncbi:MAG: helicase-related protein, partial [Candidatus Adiutrix sp.]
IDAKAYHAAIFEGENQVAVKEKLEQQLLNNQIKVLVATVALGMGFDKPDLGFVIHFQRPSSVVHYYQQVGRAGRAVDEAYGVLLCGEEDDHIAQFFQREAFPPQHHISEVLTVLDKSEGGLSKKEMQGVLNLRDAHLDKAIKFLVAESPSPIIKIKNKFQATAAAASYQIDEKNIKAITDIRMKEQEQMRTYMGHFGCLMSFLQAALDDPTPKPCGQCRNCNYGFLLDETYSEALFNKASLFLRINYQHLKPRKKWPARNMFNLSPLNGYTIPLEQQPQEGRALSLWRDSGWGQSVADGKYKTHRFSDKLITACLDMLKEWSPNPSPKWVTCIPSLNHPELVPNFAARLADALGLPFNPCIVKICANKQQKEMENSFQQVKNLDGVFTINPPIVNGECLLVDDIVNSRWTFTVAAALLRKAGSSAVYPLALALNSRGQA